MAKESRKKWLWQKSLFVYIQKAVLQRDKKAGLLQPLKDVERGSFCCSNALRRMPSYDGSARVASGKKSKVTSEKRDHRVKLETSRMSRAFRQLQIGTGPQRLPSACSEILKMMLGLTSMRSSQRSEAKTRTLQHCQLQNAWQKPGLWERSLAITLY